MGFARIALKILGGPLLGVLTSFLGFGLALFLGKELQQGKQAKKELKIITQQIEVKNEIKNNIASKHDGYAIKQLRSKWSRND